MKKIAYTITALWNTVNIGTCMYFGYRYVWFGIQTVPIDRALIAMFATFIIFLLSVLACSLISGK